MAKLVKATLTPCAQGNDVFRSAHKRATDQLEQAFQKISGFKPVASSSTHDGGEAASKGQSKKR